MEAGLLIIGLLGMVVIAAAVTPWVAHGQLLVALAIAVPVMGLLLWLQWLAWRQKYGPRRS